MRWWLRVVAAITVAAATTSACQGSPVRPPKPPKLIVARLGLKASGGVIARGTVGRQAMADQADPCEPAVV
jgi:hypothetical protein